MNSEGNSERDENQDTPAVRFNVVRHLSKVLVKVYRIVQGKIVKDMSNSGRIPEGCTITTESATLREYILEAFAGGSRQYIVQSNVDLGIDIPLRSKGLVSEDAVHRTAATLRYVTGPAVLTIDHDPHLNSRFTFETPAQLCAVLIQHFPVAFEGVAHGSYYSSSSFIHGPDGILHSGARGHHTVFAVADAFDLPRFSEALFKRLCILGHGYVVITRSGAMIFRTIFDQKVIEPQQPVFAGGAHCRDGITQRRPDPIVHRGGYVKTQAVESLSAEEETLFISIVKKAKADRAAEAKKVAFEYKRSAVAALTAKGVPEQRAIRTVESRIGGTLTGSDVLCFAEHGEVTVSDILADPDKYDRAHLHDPVERDYGSSSTAIFFANNTTGKPQVFSHAHGGASYFLKHDEESLTARLQGMNQEDLRNGWRQLVAPAELPADGLDRILKRIAKSTESSLTAVRKSFNEYLKAARVIHQGTATDPSVKFVEMLLSEHFNNSAFLICTEAKQFWSYNGCHWEKMNDGVLRGLIQRIAKERWNWIQELFAWQGKDSPPAMSCFVDSTLKVLSSACIKPGDPLRLMLPKPSVINVKNGSLWLDGDAPVLRPHKPEDYLTSCSPIEYDPKATAPVFERLLRSMLCDEHGVPFEDQNEMYRHVLELLGYVCQSARFLKVFYIFYGPGDNGKTQLAHLLELIVGVAAIAFDRLSGVNEEGSRFAAARLIGKLAVIDDDATNDYQLPDGFLKKIAEGKPLTAEEKFKGPVTFICGVVPMILTNSLPITNDTSRGMRTRAQVIYFPRQFKRKDEVGSDHPNVQRPELWRQVFEHELPGVLNLLIEGFYRVKSRGSFLPPPSAIRAFDMWLSNANAVPRFVSEGCEPIDPNKAEVTITVFYEAFTRWCRAENVQDRFRPSQNTFKKRLLELGYRVDRTNIGSAVFGLRLKVAWNPAAYGISISDFPKSETSL